MTQVIQMPSNDGAEFDWASSALGDCLRIPTFLSRSLLSPTVSSRFLFSHEQAVERLRAVRTVDVSGLMETCRELIGVALQLQARQRPPAGPSGAGAAAGTAAGAAAAAGKKGGKQAGPAAQQGAGKGGKP